MITDAEARKIAYDWHGGTGTALYAFASTGAINTDRLDHDIESELHLLRMATLRDTTDVNRTRNLTDLYDLTSHIKRHGTRPIAPPTNGTGSPRYETPRGPPTRSSPRPSGGHGMPNQYDLILGPPAPRTCNHCGETFFTCPGERLRHYKLRKACDAPCRTALKVKGTVAAKKANPVPMERTLQRFWGKVDKCGDCWLWTGDKNHHGYGRLYFYGKMTPAHRIAYEATVGPIPEGLQLDHLCRNPACVNPAHLEPVTPRENTLRGEALSAQAARRNHCARGHEYTAENTRIYRGYRVCLTCQHIKIQARTAKRRQTREANRGQIP